MILLRPRRRGARILLWGSVICLMVLLCAACMRHFVREPSGFFGVPHTQPAPRPPFTATPDKPYPLQSAPPYTVALDAGHGGYDSGAVGLMREVELCEETVDALFVLLAADPNYTPVRTRENGVDLSTDDRAQAATEQRASLLLSVHGNYDADTRQSHGFECFPAPPGRPYAEESLRFAKNLTAGMQAAGHRLRGENGVRFLYYTNGGHSKKLVESSDMRIREQKSFGMVEKPHCPAVLAEQCFISNYNDMEAWASPEGCAKAARIYYKAICTYFDTQPLD
ncbi:MAG: N-acetylmuramoyl-L-alanine amidase [Ruthenibacterium sp.]